MLGLLLTLAGMAAVESLSMLNIGVTSAIVYDARLHRRSPLPGGLSFLAGLFASSVVVGITVVSGLTFLTELTAFELTPVTRYRGELIAGVVLVGLACYPSAARKASPRWGFTSMRRRPWLLAGVGAALGLAQAGTDVMYLAALALLSAHHPRPMLWPLIVMGYCAIQLLPALLLLGLATRRTARAQRVQRRLVRLTTRYGPRCVRALCLIAGAGLIIDSALHHQYLW